MMKQFLRPYFRNEDGSTVVIFAYCLMAVAIASGVALDYNRVNDAKTSIAAVADAAAIAAVSNIDAGETAMKTVAKKYIAANVAAVGVKLKGEPTLTYDKSKAEFTVQIGGTVPTSLMAVAGYTEMEVNAKSVAVRPETPPVEMALSLDTTGSMAGTKITALKAAATKMVTAVLKNKKAKIGIVPFASYVNVGVSRRNEKFFDVPADYSTKTKSCSTTYPNKKGCYIKSTNTTCSGVNDGVPYSYACVNKTEVCADWGAAVKTCTDVDYWYKFYGCVGSREENARAKIDDSTKKYPGFLNVTCGAEIQPLTTNLTTVKNKISSLSASGETYMPGGLTWGWNMLTSAEPLTEAENAKTLAEQGGRKVLVLMTDGVTTLVPANTAKATHTAPGSSTYKKVDYSNTLSADLCKAIKADNIDIYTVQFDVVDAKLQKLLTECASSPAMSFQAANSDELVAAFDQIVADLSQIRIVR